MRSAAHEAREWAISPHRRFGTEDHEMRSAMERRHTCRSCSKSLMLRQARYGRIVGIGARSWDLGGLSQHSDPGSSKVESRTVAWVGTLDSWTEWLRRANTSPAPR